MTLYYVYYVTPWINSRYLLQRVTAISRKALEVRIYLTYEVIMVKKKNKNWMETWVCCFHLNQKHQFPVRRLAVYSSILYKADPDPDLQKKRTLYQNLLYELKTHFRQIWGCWFQIWQELFKILAHKYSYKAFLIPKLVIFVFSQNFAVRQIWGCWFQIWQ